MISVIIPTLNEERNIEACLVSLKSQEYSGKYEVILVDGHSKDNTPKIARKYASKVFFHPPHGPAHARNCGAADAKYGIVAFVDADCDVQPDWLQVIEDNFKDSELIGLGGVLKPKNPRFIDKVMFTLFSDWWVKASSWLGVWQLYGNNCAYRKKEFCKVCGFSTKVSFWEDTELSMRMKKLGKLKIDRRLVVRTSTRRFRQQGYWKVFWINLQAFINFSLGRQIKTKYFEEIKH